MASHLDTFTLSTLLGPLCALMSSFTWAFGTTIYTNYSRTYPGYEINYVRACIAFLMFLTLFCCFGPGFSVFLKLSTTEIGLVLLSTAGSYALGDALFYHSAHHLGSSTALAISSAYPIFSTLMGALWLHEAIGYYQIIGMLCCVAGIIALIIFKEQENTKPSKQPTTQQSTSSLLLGVSLAMATALMWSLNTYALQQAGQHLDFLTLNTLRFLLAILALGMVIIFNRLKNKLSFPFILLRMPKPTSAYLNKPHVPQPSIFTYKTLSRFIPAASIEAFLGSAFFSYGLAHSPLSIAATLSSLAPLFSMPLALYYKTEQLTLKKSICIAMIVVGIALLVT